MLRKKGVVNKFVEFYGEGLDRNCRSPTAPPSPTWRPDMARPAASSRSTRTLGYLKTTGRGPAGKLTEAYAGAGPVPEDRPTRCSPTRLTARPGRRRRPLAGPKRPQDRVPLSQAASQFVASGRSSAAPPTASASVRRRRPRPRPRRHRHRRHHLVHQHVQPLRHGGAG